MEPLRWEENTRLPRGVAAILAALQFPPGSPDPLYRLNENEWRQTLDFCDRSQLTLLLGQRRGSDLPPPIRRRIAENTARKRIRDERAFAELVDIVRSFESRGVAHLLLKGFAHGENYAADPGVRPRYDLDFFAPRDSLETARDALAARGYEPVAELEHFPTDHLPVMVQKTGYRWRGDFYDPDIPFSVDLHFRFWDEDTEGFPAPGIDQFWRRRVEREIGGQRIVTLDEADELGYAALHLVRHLLRGSVRAYHVYEIAYFLHQRADDSTFWDYRRDRHPLSLRRIEGIAFVLARRWFGCRIADAVEEEIRTGGEAVLTWAEHYAASPVEAPFHPNKSELWLHLALVSSLAAKLKVVRRRMVPLRLPGPVDAVYVPAQQLTLAIRASRGLKYAAHLCHRTLFHTRTLAATLADGPRWLLIRGGLDRQFLKFLVAASVYHFGVFVFVLLYNLYLLDLGWREDALGWFTSAMTLGTIAGAVPTGALVRRRGIRFGLVAAALSAPLLSILRVLASSETGLACSAFVAGAASSIWFVASVPAVAQLSSEKRRPRAYSLWFGAGIATGILGGLVGSRLPNWLATAGMAADPAKTKQAAIVAGCAIAACAAWPLSRLKFPGNLPREHKTYPSGPFIWRFLGAMAVWQFAIGAFNPLFTAYFSRQLNAPVEQIGNVFASSQLLQAAAVLLSPWLFRRLGLASGIAATQLSTALVLASLALGPSGYSAALAYALYMSLQVASEPGLFSLLMRGVRPGEQSGASGLNIFVMFCSQALAAAFGGWVASHAGYPALLFSATVMASMSALCFHMFFKSPEPAQRAEARELS